MPLHSLKKMMTSSAVHCRRCAQKHRERDVLLQSTQFKGQRNSNGYLMEVELVCQQLFF